MRTTAALGCATLLWAAALVTRVDGRQEHIHHAPAQARLLASPLDLTDADLAAGQATYATRCAGCHGPAGKGGAAPAANRPAPSDLTRADLRTQERGDLVAFLESLTDLAFTSDPRFSNPWPARTLVPTKGK